MARAKELSAKQRARLLETLSVRFDAHRHRHAGLEWAAVSARLEAAPAKLWSLNEMENSGGEPDVVVMDKTSDGYAFVDCSAQSPKGRRSVCYDGRALKARKQHKPRASAVELAGAMNAALLSVAEYRQLQEVDVFDSATSSWVETPAQIRRLGGALFCDRRYDTVFVYHNGAESYYAGRGFRCVLRV